MLKKSAKSVIKRGGQNVVLQNARGGADYSFRRDLPNTQPGGGGRKHLKFRGV